MKLAILVAFAFVAVAVASPGGEPLKILRSEFNVQPDGAYEFVYETEDGIARQESAVVKEGRDADNKPIPVLAVRGSYSYTDPEGKFETINYSADEDGYKAEGDSIPKVPVARR